MLQLWKFVLLCGVLTGTSESLLDNLGSDLSNVVNELKPILHDGLETVDNTLKGVLEKLKVDLGVLQKSSAWQLAKQKAQEAEKLLNNVVSKLLPTNTNTLGLKISDSLILDVKAEPIDGGKGLNLSFPVTADVTTTLPIIGQIINLKASLDLLTAVSIETDPQTNQSVAVLGECASDPTSISLSLLDNRSQIINNVVNRVINTLKSTVSFLVQKEICPLIRIFLHSLDVQFIQQIIDNLQHETQLQTHI
ncbi:BPI fold-containing family A member 2 [Macaca fascicularis]|uniref:Parotid secretory protein n=1 Tax=Macaca fascicularis TaxID=9541 RepID=G7PGL7_MACFA|nr:BPI fold-containing family A member 2 [Macaca fascicularis]XP_045218688.1 BPI fold-containing family A member 2 [Macaca fascicularis]EHH65423.1 Parotid secretory protein [Macaca fascicularis]